MSVYKDYQPVMKAPYIHSGILHRSECCEIKEWGYNFSKKEKPASDYNDALCLVYVRKGDVHFDVAGDAYDLRSGFFLLDKPDYEYRFRPSSGESTIINYGQLLYEGYRDNGHGDFFSNRKILSVAVKATPELEYLHFHLMRSARQQIPLEVDVTAVELLDTVIGFISKGSHRLSIAGKNVYHGSLVEQAKQYLHEHFSDAISLQQIADHCCVSVFHFARVFKRITGYTPHQYLTGIRMKHARKLMLSTFLPVTDISFQSGFSSLEYFSTAFKSQFGLTPSQFIQHHRNG